jgi:signal transduction histidine kinase
MQSPSRFAKRLSISAWWGANAAPLLVAATTAAALTGAVGLVLDAGSLAAVGLIAATAFAGAFAVYLIVSERRRHESAEGALHAEAAFLESLVDAIAAVSSTLDADAIVERTRTEAQRLFRASDVRFVEDAPAGEARIVQGGMVVPLAARGQPIGALALRRTEPFQRVDIIRATVLADFASRSVENARLLVDAGEREAERERLTGRLITAEQDERRRLSLFLHDGPLQSMSGIALMHDAALAAIEDGRYEDAAKVIATSLDRERDTIRSLRDLSFAIEPLVLRDQGFAAAVSALGEQIERAHRITVSADVGAGERLGEKTQAALYQIIRESLNQAVRRGPQNIGISVAEQDDGALVLDMGDDGMGERRRASIEAIEERVRVLNARMAVEPGDDGGTIIRVVLPAYVAAANG